ncbi:hypothetical protein DDE18_11500 [Nocardioides gansuensis]|uniref:Uncharacterized protein n=1 Tax=Nocardioides gansuensis TaxID=2138300 RepID=A0A2T8FB55_9ACTN|nr:hypothetical protein [Nocardioides gansuensis]PVG82958.1 hypothetical protein DDE18_11500 [Nocardioides gansuensis]
MAITRTPLGLLVALALAGCGTAGFPIGQQAAEDPPVFHVQTEKGTVLQVDAWTYCDEGFCADGAPSDHPPKVGSPDVLTFEFDHAGWDFDSVTFREHGTRGTEGYTCAREVQVEAEKTGERTFRIHPAGPAGDWDVDIFGRGPAGDAVTTVHWKTPVEGTYPEQATGQAAVLADHDGELDSYGVELGLSDLDRHYPGATAQITVTSAEGGSVTIPVKGDNRRCYSEGSLGFRASDERGREAIGLGSAPFTYAAAVMLAGKTYVGTGVWPDDTNDEIRPAIPLTDWQPALPAYDGTPG